ncbi:MAG: hypothetical protein SFV19_01645 [Rhodospirillaceae bacterium]|nr:hypothetical protein [Rhodospirillaceae bacterium]
MWTKEKIASLEPLKRARLYANARGQGTTAGDELAQLIVDTGLPFSEGAALSIHDPVYIKMHQIVFSPEGRQAAIAAVDEGLPPLAGVDPLINQALMHDYGKHNMGTANAGSIVAELMRHLGYKETGTSAPLPPGCVAKTGMVWKK